MLKTYSQDKLAMLSTLSNLFSNPQNELLRIQGPPGCGKTAVIDMIVRHYLSFNTIQKMVDPDTQKLTSANICLTATINKAVAVIDAEVLPDLELEFGSIHCTTIYSLLGLKVFNDFHNGQSKVQRNKNTSPRSFPINSLIIIDEAGYTDNILWSHIKEQLLGKKLNIIFIADFYQASPVNCKISPIFHPSIPVYNLTERFRYPTGSAIHLNSLLCEKAIDTGVVDKLKFDNSCEHVTSKDLPDLIKNHFIDGNEDTRILAYTNKAVVHYNKNIAMELYGDSDFHEGQDVISNKFYKFGEVCVRNEQKLTITGIGEEFLGINDLRLKNISFGKFSNLTAPVPVDYYQFWSVLNNLKAAADWSAFYAVTETIMDVRHSWASTIHKSQGSTYDYSILDFNDLLTVTDPLLFYRLLNVAMTRPRHKVFIFKD